MRCKSEFMRVHGFTTQQRIKFFKWEWSLAVAHWLNCNVDASSHGTKKKKTHAIGIEF